MKRILASVVFLLIFISFNAGLKAQQLTLSQKTACTNDTVRVSLNTTAITKLAALTIYISYDTAVLRYVGLESTTTLLSGIIASVPTTGAAAWKLGLSWVDNSLVGVNFGAIKLTDIKFIYKGGSTAVNLVTDGTELANISGVVLATTYVNGSVNSTVITAQPSSPSVCTGVSANIPISAATGATFQWQSKSGSVWNNVSNGTSYSGVTTNSLQVLQSPFALNNTSYRCKVVGSCTDYSVPSVLTVKANPIVVITHDTTICKGVPTTISGLGSTGAGTLTYTWNNGLGTGISKSVAPIVNTTYQLTVTDTSSCTATASMNVTMITPAANAGTITGLTSVCQLQNSVAYSVPTMTGATAYVWTLPTGASGSSTNNSISVNYSNSAASGNIKIKVLNMCGDSSISTQTITVGTKPPTAGVISGLANVTQGQNAVVYTVPTIANATTYNWTLPSGVAGSSTTNSISVNVGAHAYSGLLKVSGSNTCGTGSSSTLFVKIPKKLVVKFILQGLYNNMNHTMVKTQDLDGNHFPNAIADDVTIDLIESFNPYASKADFNPTFDTTGFTQTMTIPGADTASYYIVVKHRNHVDTWSKLPVSFNTDSIFYSFTNSNTSAFENNLFQVAPGVFAIYAGDITGSTGVKDGAVTIWDLADVFDAMNDFTGLLSGGYVIDDLTGDANVDIWDVSFVFDNMNTGVGSINPLTVK